MFNGQRSLLAWLLAPVLVAFAFLGCDNVEVITFKAPEVSHEPELEIATQPEPPAISIYAARMWMSEDRLPWDVWYLQYLRGQRIGYFHIEVSQGASLLRIHRTKLLEITDGDDVVRVEEVVNSLEYPDGKLATFEVQKTTGGDSTQIISADFVKRELRIKSQSGTKKTTTSVKWEDEIWGILGIQSILFSQPMQAEETRRAKLFIESSTSIELVDLVAGNPELTSLPGGITLELLPVVVTSADGRDFAQLKAWVDKAGTIKKSITLSGTKLGTFEVSAETGQMVADEYRLKSLLDTSVSFEGKLPAAGAKSATYHVEGSSFDMYGSWASNVRQTVKSISALSSEITVHDVSDSKALALFKPEPPTAEYLSSSNWIQPEDPEIISLAKQLIGNAQTPIEVVSKLAHGLAGMLTQTDFSETVLSSAETSRQLRGDCSEYTMLLVAMLRSQEIPARLASGLKLDPGRRKLIYHMWAEAWLDNRWLPVDGTTGDIAGIGCIKMFDSAMTDSNPYSAILPVFEKMPSMRVRLADAQ